MYIDYNQPILPYSIPNTLREIVLPFNFNQSLTFNTVENNVPKTIPCFPSHGLISLDLGTEFNQTIPSFVLPQTLKTLYLSVHYNQPLLLDAIPQSCTYISMGKVYNHPLYPCGLFPSSLRTLILSDQFNHPIEYGQLPETLADLQFGTNFNQDLPLGLLPTFLLKISFGSNFTSIFEPSPFTRKIKFGENYQITNDHLFPTTLNAIGIKNSDHEQLPNVYKLKVHSNVINPHFYPTESLRLLELSNVSLSQLETGFLTNFKKLQFLKFGDNFDAPLNENHLPKDSLLSLEFGIPFNQPLSLSNMKKLKYIKFGERYTYINHTIFPDSIQAITYDSIANIKILSDSLPQSLEFIELSHSFFQKLSNDWLPNSIKEIVHCGEPIIDPDFYLINLRKFYINRNNQSILNDNLLFVNQYYNIIEVFKQNQNNIIKKLLEFK
ncbi:hypothetical protein DICPUDRAFT_43628 [Dictyostelium purpureum]|uniref:FNIP repeat-containing protein n=1 Tax=Dictyostelium purpureum TaxID=5786 RepID=F1A4H5_DICPU|nr:uncharacterized protein DICPUDRAFT_43628 [Dictyostelium purpureum]EGC28903.1 hypothetical protein DICPUDRAFT_43628 [Dictyostelium purpureum]|eukprot:XP_003294568.1 hypothetical protein DICPUDRAFT_43628 [Dictyostelium purpureum]